MLLLMAVGLIQATGCTVIPKMDQTQLVQVPAAPLAPTAEELRHQMMGKGQKIVVTPVETTNAAQQPFANSTYEQLMQRMMQTGNTIVDRSLAKKLRSELLAAEQSGVYKSSGPDIASIALMSKIVSIGYDSEFTEAYTTEDDDGDKHYHPARCGYTSNAKLYVRAYRLPAMELINTYTYQGRYYTSTETRSSHCRISKTVRNSYYQTALNKAIRNGSSQTMNDIAPSAYVLERRDAIDKESSSLFRITISKTQGAREGIGVRFFRKEKRENPITHDVRYETIFLGEGKITSYIDNTGSYAFVDDKKLIARLRVGDIVKLDHNSCLSYEINAFGSCVNLLGP